MQPYKLPRNYFLEKLLVLACYVVWLPVWHLRGHEHLNGHRPLVLHVESRWGSPGLVTYQEDDWPVLLRLDTWVSRHASIEVSRASRVLPGIRIIRALRNRHSDSLLVQLSCVPFSGLRWNRHNSIHSRVDQNLPWRSSTRWHHYQNLRDALGANEPKRHRTGKSPESR